MRVGDEVLRFTQRCASSSAPPEGAEEVVYLSPASHVWASCVLSFSPPGRDEGLLLLTKFRSFFGEIVLNTYSGIGTIARFV